MVNCKALFEGVPVHAAQQALLDWADVLDTIDRKSFDMTTYASQCGTTACVFGWGTAVPAIAEYGWRLKKPNGETQYVGCDVHGKFDSTTEFSAMEFSAIVLANKAFNLVSRGEWSGLFFGLHLTKNDAAMRLRMFAERYQ